MKVFKSLAIYLNYLNQNHCDCETMMICIRRYHDYHIKLKCHLMTALVELFLQHYYRVSIGSLLSNKLFINKACYLQHTSFEKD
jgi:hypothetical protein